MKLHRAVGIDLGTTNSAISMLSPAGEELLLFEDRFKRKTYPSAVGWDAAKSDFISGWDAWNRRGMQPEVVQSVKRKMGKSELVKVGPKQLKPEEVSSKILAALATGMNEFVADRLDPYTAKIEQALITVPAYFDAPQIEATRVAGELAGLEVLSLVQEPTAAAMYYAWKHGIGDGTFLVYDLGGGTFDVSVIRCLHGEFQVLGIDGDNFLGGDDFDRRLAEHFRKLLVEQGYALDLDIVNNDDDRVRFFLLIKAAQEVKESLSTSQHQYVGLRDIFLDHDGNSVTLETEISREEFETLISDLIDQTIQCCEGALARSTEAASVGLSDVDHVLLVGGSTKIPAVFERVSERLAQGTIDGKPLQDEPDTCVALGAAIAAANVSGVGLEAENGERALIQTSLYTHENRVRIAGLFTEIEHDVDSIVLLNQANDIAAIARPEKEEDCIRFDFDEVSLPDEGRYIFMLEPCDEDGEAIVSFPVVVHRGGTSDYRPTGSALSNPSVLAKDIYLEVVRDGRADRQILLPRGSSLPSSETFRFYTADKSGAVVLRLYQNRFPIRTIHLSLPEGTDVGTPVNLDLKVDESMSMIAGGEVAGQKFWAQIEPPAEREARDWTAIEALLDTAEDVSRQLWGYESRFFQQKIDPLVAGIRETARTDPDKLQALAGRLESVLEEYHNRDGELTPGWSRLVMTMDAIKRVVFRGDGSRQLGLNTEEWREKLSTLEDEGRAYYDDRDQDGWTRTFSQVQAIWESIAQDEFRFSSSSNSTDHLLRLRETIEAEIDDLMVALSGFNYSDNPETQSLQQKELNAIERDLNQRVAVPLSSMDVERLPVAQAKVELDKLYEATSQLRKRYDKVPTLGLVSR